MASVWQLIICLFVAAFAAAGGAAGAAMALAIASLRFSNLKKDASGKNELSGAAKFCAYNSEKMASVISLGRRFFFALEAFSAFFAATAVADMVDSGLSRGGQITAALAATAVALLLQYACLDIPAAKIGRNMPARTIGRLGGFMYAAFVFFAPFDIIARIIAKKAMPEKLRSMESGFDYIDVEMMLRADENDAEAITPYTGKIVKNAFKLQELDVSDVMLPRSQVVFLDTEISNAENIARVLSTNHTRYPICREDLDDCFGIVHVKDIFIKGGIQNPDEINLMRLRRETFRVRESDKLEIALAKLLKYRLHMALVEDEFGGVIGVLTLDAALGELVGQQIRDEFDAGRKLDIKAVGRRKYKVSGRATLRSVEDFLDVDFDTDEVSTFGGLVTFLLGRFPEKGERLYLKEQHLRIVIDSVEDKMVGECTVELDDPDKEQNSS